MSGGRLSTTATLMALGSAATASTAKTPSMTTAKTLRALDGRGDMSPWSAHSNAWILDPIRYGNVPFYPWRIRERFRMRTVLDVSHLYLRHISSGLIVTTVHRVSYAMDKQAATSTASEVPSPILPSDTWRITWILDDGDGDVCDDGDGDGDGDACDDGNSVDKNSSRKRGCCEVTGRSGPLLPPLTLERLCKLRGHDFVEDDWLVCSRDAFTQQHVLHGGVPLSTVHPHNGMVVVSAALKCLLQPASLADVEETVDPLLPHPHLSVRVLAALDTRRLKRPSRVSSSGECSVTQVLCESFSRLLTAANAKSGNRVMYWVDLAELQPLFCKLEQVTQTLQPINVSWPSHSAQTVEVRMYRATPSSVRTRRYVPTWASILRNPDALTLMPELTTTLRLPFDAHISVLTLWHHLPTHIWPPSLEALTLGDIDAPCRTESGDVVVLVHVYLCCRSDIEQWRI